MVGVSSILGFPPTDSAYFISTDLYLIILGCVAHTSSPGGSLTVGLTSEHHHHCSGSTSDQLIKREILGVGPGHP